MAASQPANFNIQQFTDAGQLLVGGRLYTYAYGTTTQKAAYTDPAGTIPHTYTSDGAGGQYIALNARGELSAPLYLGVGSYDLTLKRADGSTVWTRKADGVDNGSSALSAAFGDQSGSSLVGFIQAGANAVKRLSQAKMRDHVHIRDFGAVCDGVADDTAAINAALTSGVEVWVDGTPLVTSTIIVPAHKKIRFKGGLGNTQNSYPPSYLIKSAGMTTAALKLLDCAHVEGGGLVCQAGNTGDGVAVAGNGAKLSHFLAHGAGGVGVRLGTDAGNNTNSIHLDHVTSQWNGGHGIYVHDGAGSDCNAATLIHCFAQKNGGDGIRLGHTYWSTVINCLSEVNTGYGLYLSGNNNATYPECRYTTVIGGDYNEGNTAGIIFDASYFATILNPDFAQAPSTPSNGLQGSAARTYLGGMYPQLPSVQGGPYQSKFKTNGSTDSPIKVSVNGTGSVGDGAGITFETTIAGTPHDAAIIKAWNAAPNVDGLDLQVNKNGAMTSIVKVTSYYNGISSSQDNVYNVGHPAARFNTVFAGTSAINTSDERSKTQIQKIDATVLRAWAKVDYLQYKFDDAVENKGDGARWHFGVIAQRVKAAFESEGLDPFAYGILCYDEWGDMYEPVIAKRPVLSPDGEPQTNPDGSPVMESYDTGDRVQTQVAGNRYGIRYDEALVLECAYLRSLLRPAP